jgi:DNA (cytosine-5)-methyltransferase 1
MKAVSLFAGVGGFDYALEQNGIEVVATCEIDKHAQKILSRHFPKAKLFSDVTTLTGQELFDAGFNSDGIIVGGFPCQDVSVAGKRAGLSHADGTSTRSGLFWQVVRLLEETKAKHFILENVPGLLSSNEGRDFAVVLDALVELGYGVSWRILDAQYFGVPQRRRRIFIVGSAGNDWRTSAEILAIAEGRRGYLAKGITPRKTVARKVGNGVGGIDSEWWNGGQVADSVTTTSNEQRMPDKGRLQAVVVPFTPSSFAQYEEGVGTLRSSGGDLGGGQRNIVGSLQARDYKGVGNQYVAENKLVY